MTFEQAKTILCSNLTLDHARAWEAESEKWMYISDRLAAYDISFDEDRENDLVEYVEDHFMMLLGYTS